MKKWILSLLVFFIACEHFPSNPSKTTVPVKEIRVEFLGAQYIPVQQKVDGLVAQKMNVMTFAFRGRHIQAKALEFFGSVWLEGPPENQEHDLHFTTDRLDVEARQPGVKWNMLQSIRSETTYTLVRCKLPMNQYAPFLGDQGKVKRVEIKQVWAYDGAGRKYSLRLDETVDRE